MRLLSLEEYTSLFQRIKTPVKSVFLMSKKKKKKVILICENSTEVVYHKVNNKVVLLPLRNFTALSSQQLLL